MELSSPITIYWDIPAENCETELLQRVCSDISECRPLMLQLYCDSTEILPGDRLLWILEHFKDSAIAVSLTISAAAIKTIPSGYFNTAGLKELLISASSVDDLRHSVPEVKRSSGMLPGISFKVNDSNWQELPSLVELCRAADIKRLVLPMQRLYNQEKPFMLTASEQRQLASCLADSGGTKELNLTIHDPFLWRAFNPDVPFPQAGCQAANTMIAISADGAVWPCPTLPVSLGNIAEKGLKEIIFSAAKRELRLKLRTPPANCDVCQEIAICRGGCRGRGLALEGSLDAIDPACR